MRDACVRLRPDARGEPALTAWLVPQTEDSTLQAEQLQQWQTLHGQSYVEPSAQEDSTFNLAGWGSSYTGEAIPEEEMAEWVEATVADVRALRPRHVLEIGCGTGLLLARLAPDCESYLGTDHAPSALEHVRRMQRSVPGLAGVSVSQRSAEDFSGLPEAHFDVVLLNSVVQYFPSVDYLLRVLEGAARVVRPGGVIYLGDVRDLRLLSAYHASVQLFRAPDTLSASQLSALVAQRQRDEEELVLDPELFRALPHLLPQVRGVEVRLKRGKHHNELTRFRYQVLVHVHAASRQEPAVPEADIHDWRQEGWTLESLRHWLRAERPEHVELRAIPNARLREEALTLEWLASPAGHTVAQLRQQLTRAPEAVEPETLWALADELPYAVHLTWPTQGSHDALVARLVRRDVDGLPARLAAPVASPRPWREYGNNPLLGKLHRRLVPALRQALAARLPDYMVPSAWVTLEAMPLNTSGKVDPKALPAPSALTGAARGAFVAPRDALETAIAQLWCEVLGLPQVGVQEDFFSLGGHSLLAVRLLSRLKDVLGQSLSLASLFQHPTVEALARLRRQSAPAEDLWAPLVLMQSHGSRPPFFCVPGIGGDVFYLQALARHLGSERPFYGLQAVGLDGHSAPDASLQAMAERYEREILRVRPHGPYHVGGHSLGGWVAFLLAQRLAARGEKVSVSLFDAVAHPHVLEAEPLSRLEVLNRMLEMFELESGMDLSAERARLARLDSDEERLKVVRASGERTKRYPPGTDLALVRGRAQVIHAGLGMRERPEGWLAAPVRLFSAQSGGAVGAGEMTTQQKVEGWARLCAPLSGVNASGQHFTLMGPPHAESLARQVSAWLDEVEGTSRG